MELRQLQYFVKVARMQHVTQASEELHVSQSAVSRQIHLLEKQLGTKLFLQHGRNVQLTPVGKLFLNRAEEILISIENSINEVQEFINPEAGEIRFGFLNSLGINLVPSVISKFHKDHPNVKFRFKQGMSMGLVEAVKRGGIDLALVSPVPDDFHITGETLLTEHLFAILPADHMLANSEVIRLEQLKNETFVLFSEGYSLRSIVTEACNHAGFSPRIGFEGEETDTIRGFVAAGMGVSLLPETSLKDGSPLLTAKVKVIEPKVNRTVGLIRRSDGKLPLVADVFRNFLLTYPYL